MYNINTMKTLNFTEYKLLIVQVAAHVTEFFISIAINPKPFLPSPLTKLSSNIYKRIPMIKQPKGLKLNFGCCHKLLLLLLLSTHSSLIIGGSPLLLSDGGSPPASPASHLAGLLRRRDPSTNPGPIAWWVSVGN